MKKQFWFSILIAASLALASCGLRAPQGKLVYRNLEQKQSIHTINVSSPSETGIVDEGPSWFTAASPDGSSFITEVGRLQLDGSYSLEFRVFDSANPSTPKQVFPFTDELAKQGWVSGITWTDQPYITLQGEGIYNQDHQGPTKLERYAIKNGSLVLVNSYTLSMDRYFEYASTDLRFVVFHEWQGDIPHFLVRDNVKNTETDLTLGDSKLFTILGISPDGRNVAELISKWEPKQTCLGIFNTATGTQHILKCFQDMWEMAGNDDVSWHGNSMTIKANFMNYSDVLIVDTANPANPAVTGEIKASQFSNVAWSPDSRFFAFYANPGKGPGIYVSDIKGHLTKVMDYVPQGTAYVGPLDVLGWIK